MKKWTMIAGRGAPGSVNWGYDDNIPMTVYEEWNKELHKHIGETVAITGGGGYGSQFGKLTESKIIPFGTSGKMGLSATLEDVYDPTKTWRKPEEFTPWINSWQIWVGGTAPKSKYKPFKWDAPDKSKIKKSSTTRRRKSGSGRGHRDTGTVVGGIR